MKTRQQHRSVQRTPNGRPQITDCAEIRRHAFAKVPTAATNVFFGEWAPRKGNSNQITNSTDLNMNDGNRTVWFVGENPTKNTMA